MSFKFDTDGLMKKGTDLAADAIYDAAQKAKRDLGAEGNSIVINRMTSFRRVGDKVTLGDVKFPSEDVKARFLASFHRHMK